MAGIWRERLMQVLQATASKVTRQEKEEGWGPVDKEYQELDLIGPAPDHPWHQHDTMVRMGLCEAALKHEKENRYCNLFPFDETRVVLDGDNDYINASWVTLPGLKSPFVITMGPLNPDNFSQSVKTDFGDSETGSTCGQFWRMVDQTGARLVVMLCLVQDGFTGCGRYFPSSKGDHSKHGDYDVVCDKLEERGGGNVVRSMMLKSADKQDMITHMQFTKWPNYGVAEDVGELASFVRDVEIEARRVGGPVVIHCSGGVGRSGTFSTIYTYYSMLLGVRNSGDWSQMETYLSQDELDLRPVVRVLREARHPWMVEGVHQLNLAYQTLTHIMKDFIEDCDLPN